MPISVPKGTRVSSCHQPAPSCSPTLDGDAALCAISTARIKAPPGFYPDQLNIGIPSEGCYRYRICR